jgi:signal transduction histidine kinase
VTNPRLSSDESLVLIPAAFLLGLYPALAFMLPLAPRDRAALLGLALLAAIFTGYLFYRAARTGLRRQYPWAPSAGLILNLAGVFILHRDFPAIDLLLFVTVATSGALWGLRAGLILCGLAAAGYAAVLFVGAPFSSVNWLALAVFNLLLLFVGGLTGLLATQEQSRRARLEEARAQEARLARDLQAANAALEARVDAAAADLRQAQQLKEELYEMLVHDLKSPLGTMISGLLIVRDTLPRGAEAARAALDAALKAGERQTTLLENLLDLQRLRAGALPLNPEPLDLGALLLSLVEQLGPRVGLKTIQVETHIPPGLPAVHADKTLMTRVIASLLDNAYKFTPRHGKITVTAEAGPEAVRVIVADSGPGVPGSARGAIFEKYRQIVASEAGVRDAAGLGLAFCKMVLQAHHGQISVGASPSAGAQFEFTLPLPKIET